MEILDIMSEFAIIMKRYYNFLSDGLLDKKMMLICRRLS